MCVFCGTPEPSHDLLLFRAAVLTSGGAAILVPRGWLRAARRRLSGRLGQGLEAQDVGQQRQQHQAGDHDTGRQDAAPLLAAILRRRGR